MSRTILGPALRLTLPLAVLSTSACGGDPGPQTWRPPDPVGEGVGPTTHPSSPGNLPGTEPSNGQSTNPGGPATGSDTGANVAPVAPGTGSPVTPPVAGGTAPVLEFVPPQPASAELPARTWKLSHEQYAAAVEALLGVEVDTSLFVADGSNGIFENFSSVGLVRVDLADNYLDTAGKVAEELTTDALAGLTSCDLRAQCAEAFIAEFGARAFRRPLRSDEVATYLELFELGTSEGETEQGFRATVKGLLNSPHFLYRTELGAPEDETSELFTLTDHEVAELLAFSLLDGPPPEWLAAAADAGELTEPMTLRAHVDRLLAEPEALRQLNHFLTQWLEIGHFEQVTKFEERFPGFDDVREAMAEETSAFLAQFGTTQRSFAELLLSPVPSVSPRLDEFYLSGAAPPAEPQRVGVLGLGTVLSHHAKPHLTSPTLRGTFVRARFFCQNITLPVGFTPPPLSETEVLNVARTTRDLYLRHQTDPGCSTCHRLTDNIGFTLEEFDGAGRFRTIDDTQGFQDPVDSVSELTDSDVNRPISNHVELSQALAESELVRQCMAIQAFRFYFGQGETARGLPPLVRGHDALRNDGTLGDLIAGLMTTESTFRRKRQ